MIEVGGRPVRRARPPRIFAALLLLIGAVLAVGGIQLILLSGSPYYAISGLALVLSAILLWRGHRSGAWLYLAILICTGFWAVWEVGFDGWQLLPRLSLFVLLGLWLAMPWTRRGLA